MSRDDRTILTLDLTREQLLILFDAIRRCQLRRVLARLRRRG